MFIRLTVWVNRLIIVSFVTPLLQQAMCKDKDGKSFKLYAVSKSRRPSIFDSWALAEKQLTGFSGAVYNGFNRECLAEKFVSKARIANPKYIILHSESHESYS